MATILIVDDNDSLRKMLRRVLESQDYRVVEASNGEAALKVFQGMAPDMAILDVDMGEGPNGFEVCRTIREDPYGVSIPIIFLTGMSSEEDLLQGFQEGADDYIRKPFSIPEFLARVSGQATRLQRQSQRINKLGENQFQIGNTIEGNDQSYQITSMISSGGMGVIFRGHSLADKLEVAIKTLNSNYLDNFKDIQRFLREANATIKTQHPNLSRGIEVVRTAEHCFFVMEYVKGESLAHTLDREVYLDPKRAMKIVTDVTCALEHLDSLGLVHRDVKPGNILITPEGLSVLVDMGLTKSSANEADLTTEGVILGTPYYLSPEQAMGEQIDIKSDIYSLGATLYHTITGTVPFKGASTIGIINARFIYDPEDPHLKVPQVSPEISNIVSKMMARATSDRYQTPTELLSDLEKVSHQLGLSE